MTSPPGQRDHQHDQQQKADRQIPDVHVLPRRNEVAVIAALAPRTIAYLQVPLTPARAVRLAAFTARTGVDAQQLVVDLIDDVIFANEVVLSGGVVPCLEQYRSESQAIPKSPARTCGAPQEFADHQPSASAGRPFTPLSPPKNSHPQSDAACAPPNMNSPASIIPQHSPSPYSLRSSSHHGGDAND